MITINFTYIYIFNVSFRNLKYTDGLFCFYWALPLKEKALPSAFFYFRINNLEYDVQF